MKKSLLLLSALVWFAISTLAFAAEPSGFWQTPAIAGVGRVHPLPKAALQPDAHATYKIVFNLTKAARNNSSVNPGLEHVARAINAFASAGVHLDHLKFAVVIHGSATPMVMNNAAYQRKTGAANPDLALMDKLRAAGVKIYVCGQAVADFHIAYADVAPQVTVSLS
ncbi:MAG: DsrE family protein, partial [Gemmataceae bacterium]